MPNPLMFTSEKSYRSEIGSCYAIGWNWGINVENIKTAEKISGMGLFYYVECHLLPIAVNPFKFNYISISNVTQLQLRPVSDSGPYISCHFLKGLGMIPTIWLKSTDNLRFVKRSRFF